MMNNILKNKKGAMALATTILVIATLIITIYALFTFYTVKLDKSKNMGLYSNIEDLYIKEIQLNFLIEKIVENAALGERDKKAFLNKLKLELNKYKSPAGNFLNIPDLQQVESQLKEENIIEKEGNLSLRLNLIVRHEIKDAYLTLFDASYSYQKDFITDIPAKQKEIGKKEGK